MLVFDKKSQRTFEYVYFLKQLWNSLGNDRNVITLSWSTADSNLTWNLTFDRYNQKN